jgi:SSS family solute:Na+ symporter
MMFIQVFYWSTNQVIVQRAMAARSLAEGQKGVLFASGMKLLGPIMLCLPGIIALHMPDLNIGKQDQVYGAVVRHVLPDWSLGLFAAVLVGSILSSFNSALNSASTLFSLQFYRGYFNPSASGEETVKIGKYFGVLLAVASILIAPLLAQMDSIFQYLQKVNGLYSVPIIGIFLLGITTKHVPAIAAKIGMIVGISFYSFFTFVNIKNVIPFFANTDGDLHWLHGYFISFLASIGAMLIIGYLAPKTEEEIAVSEERIPAPVDMTPWPLAKKVSVGIFGATIAIYLLLTSAAG